MSAPKGILDLISTDSPGKKSTVDDGIIFEYKKMKEDNFKENMKRELKKMEFKKI
jgi:hypothetical protein